MLLLEKIRQKNQNLTISRRDPPKEFSDVFKDDLIIELFSRLPAKSIARCRCVSKLWQSTLRRPDFTELFLTRSSSHPQLLFSCIKDGNIYFFSAFNEVQNSYFGVVVPDHHMKLSINTHNHNSKFCGSVNGLVCLTDVRFHNEIVPVIGNISTGQCILTLPKVMTKMNMKIFEVESFFGYDPVAEQFKVLSMTFPSFSYVDRKTVISKEHQVLTLGVKKPSWRMVSGSEKHCPVSRGVCINGVLYYVAMVFRPGQVHVIVSFDFGSEKFKIIDKGYDDMSFLENSTLVNYKGKLGALVLYDLDKLKFQRTFTERSKSFEMRVLEDPEEQVWLNYVYELPSMWKTDTKLYFVGMASTDEIVLAPDYIPEAFYVLYYNIERRTVRRVEIGGMSGFKGCKVYTSADHVEDVKLMEMFKTYNLRSCKRS